ncbi:MAG: chitobiase/beta-hexosaminidase C-terminal domain-containing protein [Bacteroidales bacterium]|nr:chitobiase/beta-hexosaminidase C-terminal domain-containing protein [Bacteroidales bacterium]
MKKTIKLFLAISVAIVALVSCAKGNLSGDRIVEVTLIAGNPEAPAATRTEMSGTTPYWSVGDKIGVSTGTSGNYEFSTGIAAAATSASFTGSTVSGDLYAYYPYDDDAIRTANAVTGKRLNLIKDQNPTATSFDGDADIMVAKKFTVSPENTTVEDLEFARLGAIVKIVLIDKESKMTGTQYPTSVSMTAESALAGYVMLDLVNQEMTAPYYNTSTTVTANYTNETRYAINGTNGAYLIVAPQTLAAGTSLTIAAATADYTISKTITVPAGGIELLPGKVNTLNIGLYSSHITANAYPYELYSGDISEGDYLIVYDGVAMKATIDSDRLQYTSVSISDNKVFNPGDDIVWHIAQSGEYWTIYNADSDKYAASTGAKSKAQLLDDGSDDKSKWTVTGSSTYEFVNKANAAASVNANLRRNGAYGFACYGTGTGGALSLYKLNDGKTAAGIAYARTSDTIDYGESLTPPTLSNAHGLTLASCVSSNESVATVSAAGVINVVGNPGTTTITVTWNEQTITGTTYRAGTAKYTLTINKLKVATPTFSPAAGEVAANTAVTISCATEGATIYYTVDGSTPTTSSTEGTSVTIDAAKTIKAIAVKDSYDDSDVATAAYTIAGAYDFETVAELNALVTSTSTSYSGYLTNAVVSFVPNTGTAIVKDATGSVMIYKSGHGLLQGQTYTGAITVTAIKYNSLYSEITAWSNATFTGEQTTVAPESVTLSQLTGHFDDYQNAYVSVAGLTVESVSDKNINVTDGTKTYVVYDNTSSATCGAGDVITAVGTITKYQTTEELKVWAAADITVTSSAPKAITFSQPTGAAATAGCSFTVSVGGTPITSGDAVASGTTVTLTATAGTDYEFTSWSVSGATVADASAATTTFTMGTSAVTISASFSSTNGEKIKRYVKVTSGAIGGEYLIVRETNNLIFDGSLSNPDAANNYQTATDLSSLDYDDWKNYAVTIESYSTGYSIQTAAGKYIGRNANSNGIDNSTTLGDNYVNTIEFAANGTITILGKGGRKFNYNASSGKFRYFASGNTTEIYLYKLQEVDK